MAESRFPPTRHSLLAATQGGDEAERGRARELLVQCYWKPVYKYLRLRWRADAERAADWTQEFFTRALAKDFFAAFDPARARFRTYLRLCLDGLAQELARSERRLKRGGGETILSLDFAAAEDELEGVAIPAADRLDEYFHGEWVRTLFELALADLERACEAEGKPLALAAFRRYDIEARERGEALTYAELARELGTSVSQITNWLHALRARLRELVLARLRGLCTSEEEFQAEARALLGVSRP